MVGVLCNYGTQPGIFRGGGITEFQLATFALGQMGNEVPFQHIVALLRYVSHTAAPCLACAKQAGGCRLEWPIGPQLSAAEDPHVPVADSLLYQATWRLPGALEAESFSAL